MDLIGPLVPIIAIAIVWSLACEVEGEDVSKRKERKAQAMKTTPKPITIEELKEKMCMPGKPEVGFTWERFCKENDPELLEVTLSSNIIPYVCPDCRRKVQVLELPISSKKKLTTYSCPLGHGWGASIS